MACPPSPAHHSYFVMDELWRMNKYDMSFVGRSYAEARHFVGEGGQTIIVIDTETHRIKKTLECGGYPIRIRFTPDGKRVLVACAGSNTIAVFDAAAHTNIGNAETGLVPVGMDVTPDGKHLYAACNGDNTVSVIDLGTLEKVDEFFAGEFPFSLVYVEAK